jgi:hypothetical protein
VVKDVLQDELRNLSAVQGPADDNRIVHPVVVSENAARPPLAPAENGLDELVLKVASIEP